MGDVKSGDLGVKDDGDKEELEMNDGDMDLEEAEVNEKLDAN